MYQLNDIVVYESSGVCRICDIQELSFSEDTAPNTYYILAPLFSPGDVIYTPVNSTKTVFRPAINRKMQRARRSGKKGSEVDRRFQRRLDFLVTGELAVALNLPREEARTLLEREFELV